MHQWGWESFSFTWIKDRDMAIYTVVIAAVWQSSGFVMAMFLAGLRGIDTEIMRAAQIDGASAFRLYQRIVIPMLRPAFLSAFVVLAHLAIKSYDLVVALTGGGPGRATELPATFMYSYTFTRNQMGVGAASAVIMLIMIASIIVPYLYSELGRSKRT
jgi:glucose/mannose transport system permease protein